MPHFRFLAVVTSAIRQAPLPRATTPVLMLLAGLISLGGCRLGADCDLDSYPSYGGAWQRTVRDSGRVGSIFDPGGSRASDLSARADSSDVDAKNRAILGSGVGDQDDEESADGDSPENGGKAEQEPGNQGREEIDLQEMRDRFRGLDLQDINFRGPVVDADNWQ